MANKIYVHPKKLYKYRIRNDGITDRGKRDYFNVEPKGYLNDIYEPFEQVSEARFYHKNASWAITYLELKNFISQSDLPKKYKKIFIKVFLKTFYKWALPLKNIKENPLGVEF